MSARRGEALSQVSDEQLILRVREGETRAFGQLWERHAGPALSVARGFTGLDPEDIVAEAFERMLIALQKGKGPQGAFRPYLIATVRNIGRRHYNQRTLQVDADFDGLVDEDAQEGSATAVRELDTRAARDAFDSLPERWQQALWYSEVDGLKPREMSGPLGLPANAVSALVLRAKRGFRDAWVSAQLARASSPECQEIVAELGAYTRNGLSSRTRAKVDAHIETCERCPAALAEAKRLAHTLALVILPAVAGTAAAAGYSSTLRPPSIPEMQLPVTTHAAPQGGMGDDDNRGDRGAKRLVIACLIAAVLAGGALAATFAVIWPADDGAQNTAVDEAGSSSAPGPFGSPGNGGEPVAPQRDSDTPEVDDGSEPAPTTPPSTRRPEELAPPGVPAPPASSTPPDGQPQPQQPALSAPGARLSQPDARMYPRLAGTDAQPGARIEVVNESGQVVATTTADIRGRWSIRIADGQAETRSVSVRQAAQGRVSDSSTAFTFTVAEPPAPSSPTAGSTVNAGRFNFQMTEQPGAVIQREITGQTSLQTLTIPASGRWNEYLSVAKGEHVLRLRYADPLTDDYGPWSETAITAE